MLIPANSSAEEIVRRREINKDIQAQIEQLQTSIGKNEEIITALTEIAEWTELPDPVVEEPVVESPPVSQLPPVETLTIDAPADQTAAK